MARRKVKEVPLTDEFLLCRVLGHNWEEVDNVFDKPPSFGAAYDLRCDRCGMLGRDIISRYTGERLASRRYVAPEGYRFKKDELPSRHTLKAVALKRRSERK